jgi:hypothetical protein
MPSKLQAALAMAMARQGIAPPKHWKQERFKDLEFLNDKGQQDEIQERLFDVSRSSACL